MKKKLLILILVVCCFALILCACKDNINNNIENDNTTQDDTNNNTEDESTTQENNNQLIVNESIVIKMFMENAQLDAYGDYRFREYTTQNNLSYQYNFVYSPSRHLYNCSLLVTNYSNVILYDYAAITFYWGGFKNGFFYAYHELDSIAKIEFEYTNIKFTDNSLGDVYSYKLVSNTYANLNDPNEIKEYASRSFDCLQQALYYLKSIFFKFHISTNLWQ